MFSVNLILMVPCVINLFYVSNQRDAGLSSLLLYCKIDLHVLGVLCTHHQEYVKLQSRRLVQVMYIGDAEVKSVKKVSIVRAAIADGCKGHPKHVDRFCSTIKKTA
jgi:hypothetical protein